MANLESDYSSGWKPFEGGSLLCSQEDLSSKKLKIQLIAGREIVFAGDDAASAFLEAHDFKPVGDLKL